MLVAKKFFSAVFGTIAFLYIVVFLPIMPVVAPLGLLATAYASMSTIGAVLCLLGTIAIPLAMPVSSYFICLKLVEKKYFEACLYSLLPFLVAVMAFIWMMIVIMAHNIVFG